MSGMVVPAFEQTTHRRGKPPDDRVNGGQCDPPDAMWRDHFIYADGGLPTPQADKAQQKMPIRSIRSPP